MRTPASGVTAKYSISSCLRFTPKTLSAFRINSGISTIVNITQPYANGSAHSCSLPQTEADIGLYFFDSPCSTIDVRFIDLTFRGNQGANEWHDTVTKPESGRCAS